MSKKIYLKETSRQKLLEGIDLFADAVKSTLGPSGKTVIISNGVSDPFSTKDGVTVGMEIDHHDPVMNVGIQLVKKVTSKMDADSGDGTTTATVLCRELIVLGMELKEQLGDEFNEHLFINTIHEELEILLAKLEQVAVDIPLEEIGKVALTSANNDSLIANLFQEAFNNSGKDGHINIVQSVFEKSYVDIIKGFVIELGYVGRNFANNYITGFFEAQKCKILLYDNEFKDRKEMIKLMTNASEKNPMPLIIIAKDFSKEVEAIVEFNNNDRIGIKTCLIKNHLRNDEYMNLMMDISNYSGAQIVQEFDEFDCEFGEVSNVVVKQGFTIFGEVEGTRKQMLDDYLFLMESAAKEEKSPAYSEQIKKRVDKMRNGVTTFYVGGNSDIEITEKKHRVDDAYKSCCAALKGKVVMGGGQSLVLLSKDYNQCNDYQLIFSKAIRKPFEEILKNCLHSEDDISTIRQTISFEEGYNAKTRKYENLFDSGIVDPLIVVVNGLKNAVSIALTISSTECLIVETGNDFGNSAN